MSDENEDPTLSRTVAGDATAPAGSSPELPRGAHVGRYIVLDPLGSGGMGVVYAAYDPELDRRVALKLLRGDQGAEQEVSSRGVRLVREAQALARLAHPNVVAVHDVGTWHRQVFVAMELVEGVTLRQWLAGSPRPWSQLRGVFLDAGRGLVAAHGAGLVHRDFKPSNVVIGKDGRTRVMDFGLARQSGLVESVEPPASGAAALRLSDLSLTRPGSVVGTPAYMAPELLEGRPADERSDQFSFCRALYEALYGPGGEGVPPLATLRGNLEKADARPAQGRSPEGWLRRILNRGLDPDPARRYPSMQALLADLERDPAAIRRQRSAWVLGAVLAIALGIVLRAGWERRQGVCAGAELKLAGVWDPAIKRGVRKAFLASETPDAAASWRALEQRLDGYAGSWVASHTESCEATRLRGEQSEALMDLKQACLANRLRELRAFTDVLGHADDRVVRRSSRGAESLESLEACEDAGALMSLVPPPADPATRAEIEKLRGGLATARALWLAGKTDEGLDTVAPVVAAAESVGYAPLRAESLLLQGDLQERKGALKPAEQSLQEAIWAAEAGRADELAARAWLILAWLQKDSDRYADARRSARHAGALVERLGHPDRLTGMLYDTLAGLEKGSGNLKGALQNYELALPVLERGYGAQDARVAAALDNMGLTLGELGRYEEARPVHERALAITLQVYGDSHLETSYSLNNLGVALMKLARFDEALVRFRRSLELKQRMLGSTHLDLTTTLQNLGNVYEYQGRFEQALAEYRRTREICVATAGAHSSDTGYAVGSEGDALRKLGRYDAALDAYSRAMEVLDKTLGADHPFASHVRAGIGWVHLKRGRPEAAQPELERALAAFERSGSEPGDLGLAQFGLARALWDTGADRSRAQQLGAQALKSFEGGGALNRPEYREVEAWLRSTGGRVTPSS